jgi:hypothetical protein
MAGRKRAAGANEDDGAEQRKRERQATVAGRVQNLDPDASLEYLHVICRRWNLDGDRGDTSFQGAIELAFENFGMDISTCLTVGDSTFGFGPLDDRIHEHEVELITLYHRLKEHGHLKDPETLRMTTACLEQVYYAKRMVLNAFQANVGIHQTRMGVAEDGTPVSALSEDIDTRLGSWSLRFRWIDDDINPQQRLLLHMLDRAMERKYRRQGDWCLEPVVIDGMDTHAWRQVTTIKDWMYTETRKETNWEQWHWMTSGPSVPKVVVEYLTNCVDYSFPAIQKDRSTFAFTNGVYRAKENKFYPHAGSTLPFSIAACKFFDAEFPCEHIDDDPADIPTPHFDSIMDYQEWPAEVKMWMYTLLGRMLYDTNDMDGWQVIPFCKGQASSGKCFAAGTEILMHNGTIKRVEDIIPGDLVMGDDSTPRTVLDLARGIEELYCISSKYGSMTVTRDHVLCLKISNYEDAFEAFYAFPVVEMTVGDYLDMTSSHKSYLKLYRVEFSVERIRTYAFGVTHVPGPQEYFGFQTDGNQRFCLADGTVTHNSTITLKIAGQFYDDIDVGSLSNNVETKFGLSQFYDKLLFVAPEIKSDLKIEQAEFQSIVSGEKITINIKGKTAISVEWKPPGLLAGNEVPSWCDNSGSIQRRIVLFDFSKQVTNGDMRLGDKLALEMPAILLKCNRMYLDAVAKWAHTNIWTVLPDYFMVTRDEMAQATNVLEAFLRSEDVVVQPGSFCTLDDFKSALKVYAQQNNFAVKRFTWEFFRGPFDKFGIKKTRETRVHQGKKLLKDYLDGVDIAAMNSENLLG